LYLQRLAAQSHPYQHLLWRIRRIVLLVIAGGSSGARPQDPCQRTWFAFKDFAGTDEEGVLMGADELLPGESPV